MSQEELKEIIRWVLASGFWLMAAMVLYLNISRQFKNRQYRKQGTGQRISGTPFLFTIFCFIGAGVSPLGVHPLFILAIPFEIPALGDFVGPDEKSKEE